MIFKNKKEKLYKEASEIALDNSKMIHYEAKLLVDNDHYARGFALCVISLEESAKSFLFRLVSLDLYDEHKTNKSIYDHEYKLLQASKILSFSSKLIEVFIEFSNMAQKAGYIETELPPTDSYKEKLERFKKLAEMIAKYKEIKNDSLYVGVREGRVINPNERVKKEEVLEMSEMANMQIGMVEIAIKLDNTKFLTLWKEPFMAQLKIKELLKQ